MRIRRPLVLLASLGSAGLCFNLATSAASAPAAAPAATPDPAAQFGALESVVAPELSPDGAHIVYIGPESGPGAGNYVNVVDLAARKIASVVHADAKPFRLGSCGWSANDRLVCEQFAKTTLDARIVVYSRMFAIDIDGKKPLALGNSDSSGQLYGRQYDGTIIDWMNGVDGTVLMMRQYVPDASTGRLTARTEEGMGVDLLDTRSPKSTRVERPQKVLGFVSDGRGNVRIQATADSDGDGSWNGKVKYFYRAVAERDWHPLGIFDDAGDRFEALAVDTGANAAYVLKDLDGRRALYRVALDGSLKTELVFAHPQVDVGGVVTVGRQGRVIGASYATDRHQVEYFDPAYRELARSLARALPKLPLIAFVSASADEQKLLLLASSDTDPGRYYLFDRSSNKMTEALTARPELIGRQLATVKTVTYPAADGTQVPAYLTLPPGKDSAAGLPAIVMPHGGPAARDVWGFDWWAQYYAARGFAVLQPNFRGSAGFGNDWFVTNGFKSWKTAIGDIVDAGRWLIKEGGVDPGKLAIAGWSYGGYAALQANLMDADLFKAVVAVAPVTDLALLKSESRGFTNERVTREFIGEGPHVAEGSPARHAAAFKAPVLMFHGDMDANVDVAESRAMDTALKRAGKRTELVVYPKLDHQLYDSAARSDMLRRSYEFLRTQLKL